VSTSKHWRYIRVRSVRIESDRANLGRRLSIASYTASRVFAPLYTKTVFAIGGRYA